VETLRKRWKPIILILFIILLFGIPPAVPWLPNLQVVTDKESYMRGETIMVSAYFVNENPFPIRLLPYNKIKADLLGFGDTASNATQVDWGAFASVYIPANSKHILFVNSTLHPKEVGIRSLKVDVLSFDSVYAREFISIIVMMDDSILSETGRSAVDSALEYALIQQEIPDYRILAEKKPIVLSSMCLGDYQPQIPGVELQVLTLYEIQQKADQEGDFLYLNFKYIRVKSSSHVSVSLDNNWIRARDSTKRYLSGGGFTLDMYKNEDTWELYPSAGWIS